MIDRIVTLQGSHEAPVQLATMQRVIVDLAEVLQPDQILIESWHGLQAMQELTQLGWPAGIATRTAKSNSEEWSTLAQLDGRLLSSRARFRRGVLRRRLHRVSRS